MDVEFFTVEYITVCPIHHCVLQYFVVVISMAWCKTAVTPLPTHCNYCSLAQIHRYYHFSVVHSAMFIVRHYGTGAILSARVLQGCFVGTGTSVLSPKRVNIWYQWNILQYIIISLCFALCCGGHIDGLVQDCSNTIVSALELLQSCTKPSIFPFLCDTLSHVHREALRTLGQYNLPGFFMVVS